MKYFITTTLAILLCCGSTAGYPDNEGVGTFAGLIAGGLLGSTIGRGPGQVVAITAGAIAGGLLGGNIGRNMDENDRVRITGVLDRNPNGEPAHWRNAHTGVSYEVIPMDDVYIRGYSYCREYRTIIYGRHGRKRVIYETACRQPNGYWRVVG